MNKYYLRQYCLAFIPLICSLFVIFALENTIHASGNVPKILLRHEVPTETNKKIITLQGSATSENGIIGVTVKQPGKLPQKFSITQKGGTGEAPFNFSARSDTNTRLLFYLFINLDPGQNTITIEAIDKKKNVSTKVLTIIRVPENLSAAPTPPIASREETIPTSPAHEKRIALLIGNGAYIHAPLSNPVNDADDVAAVLKNLGFDILLYKNLNQRDMKKAIDQFGQKLKNYDIGLFYYSGHGTQVNGENYLIPIDAEPQSENDVEYDCINAGRVLGKMEDSGNTSNFIILDACRNNPFEKGWTKSASGGGLAFMNAPSGSLIAYATSPGNVAFDNPHKRNSPYTAALLQHLETPNITILEMFQRIRVAVEQETNDQQTPWESTSLRGNFYFRQQ